MTINKGAKADLFYGSSGTLKTTNIGKAALWAMKRFGKVTRLVTADGGGYEPIASLVDAGIVFPWNIREHKNLIEAIDQASQGYWPEDVNDPNSPLVAPFVISYNGTCPNEKCKEVISSKKPVQTYPCPKCKTQVVFQMSRVPNPANDLSKIAIVAFEGITSLGDSAIAHLQKQHAVVTGDKEPPMLFKDGDTTYSGASGGYYGLIQGCVPDWIMKSNMIPVEKVIWTGHEAKGEDDATKVPVYGPAFPGAKAAMKLTGKAGMWFGNMLHFEKVEAAGVSEKGVIAISCEYRMYLTGHADAVTKIIYPAKTRAPFQTAHKMPEYLNPPDVEKLYNMIDELQASALDEVRAIRETVEKSYEQKKIT